MAKVKNYNLFSIPICVIKLNDDEINIIENEYNSKLKPEFYSNRTKYTHPTFYNNHSSTIDYALNIVQKLNLDNYASILDKYFKYYLNNLDMLDLYEKLFLRQSWINISEKNSYNNLHNHPSFISSIYYLHTENESGNLWIENMYQLMGYNAVLFLNDKNMQTKKRFEIKSEKGTLIFMPGFTTHSVAFSQSEKRIAMMADYYYEYQ